MLFTGSISNMDASKPVSNEITREPPIGGMVKQFCSFFSCRGVIFDHSPLFLNRAEVRHGYYERRYR